MIVDADFIPKPEWAMRIYQKCPNIKNGGLMLNDLSIALASLAAFYYSSYLGLLMQRSKFGHSWPKIYDTSAQKTWSRFGSVMILSIPTFICFAIKF